MLSMYWSLHISCLRKSQKSPKWICLQFSSKSDRGFISNKPLENSQLFTKQPGFYLSKLKPFADNKIISILYTDGHTETYSQTRQVDSSIPLKTFFGGGG